MRREREGSYHTYRIGNPDSYKVRRILLTPHNDRNPLLINQRSRNGIPIISGRYIPSLSELKRIKEVKIRHIKTLVQNDLYDTPQRQIETARRITDILLVVKDREN